MSDTGWQRQARMLAVMTLWGAFGPNRWRNPPRWTRTRWGIARKVALDFAALFVIRQFVLPNMREWQRNVELSRAELQRELGREPTAKEFAEYRARQ